MKCALDMHVYSLVCVLYLFLCVFMCVGVLVCLCIHKVRARVVHRIQKCTVWGCGPLCVFSRCVRCVHVCLCKCYLFFVCSYRRINALMCVCVCAYSCVCGTWVWVYLPPYSC